MTFRTGILYVIPPSERHFHSRGNETFDIQVQFLKCRVSIIPYDSGKYDQTGGRVSINISRSAVRVRTSQILEHHTMLFTAATSIQGQLLLSSCGFFSSLLLLLCEGT